MPAQTITLDQLVAKHADDIAFAAEAQAATAPETFIDQLETAARNLGHFAGINGAEDLDTAITYLADAVDATGRERDVLVRKAAKYLKNTADMVDEFRLMV